jgi:deoxyxylulose-5-phosphate synthase
VLEQVGGSVPVVRFGLPDAFVQHGDRTLLLEDLGLTPRVVAAAAALRPAALTRVK